MKTLSLTKYSLFIFIFIFGLFIIMPIEASANSLKTDINSFVPNDDDEKFNRIFREGRDLIDKEEWAKATEKFKEIVCDCPEKKSVDAAFYWLAFCYKKQKMVKEADQTIERLLKNFPKSSWIEDAKVMKYQLTTTVRAPLATRTVNGALVRPLEIGNIEGAITLNVVPDQKTPLDRQDEIKLAAFQSLFAADQKKAIETMGELFKKDSTSSETLKREVLRSLRSPLSFRTPFYAENVGFRTYNSINPQNLELLKNTLFKSFEDESNVKLRSNIVFTIANVNDEQSANYLVKIYNSEANKDIKKSVISSFVQSPQMFWEFPRTPATTATARNQSGTFPAQSTSTVTVTQGQTASVASVQGRVTADKSPVKKIYLDKLVNIVQVERDSELRQLAFVNLQGFANWDSQNGILESLIKMYDEENDDKFKTLIIASFSRIDQKPALEKLFYIVKNDNSDKLRIEAIRALSSNKSPEAVKFLAELIK